MIYINIGSNLNSLKGDRFYNLKKTIQLITANKFKILKISNIYETPSYPNKKNPKFLNISLSIDTKEKPESLIKIFQTIEKKLQRNRTLKNQPRTCDIDIIDYYSKIINTNQIVLPHPRAHLRNFVLYPLREISPNWLHPVFNKKIDFLIKKLNFELRNEITRLNESVIIDQ
ncbi:MAG: 2-amino-4-hydroxy-6-hydroxymethyldihydropteridine diphosphokinase [Proteobacteria bacterium]|jgi:2-amino-4-hydroxy-6-hydroxymethyldihydropteridine diphosphokinase|nr:2-amino-4-hydroxy-6-hydroxymethyldihydropteridine diphosphokinase [Pseudomonadota bacterium]